MTVKPHDELDSSKKSQVEQMFNNIAPNYDFLNHLLSFGIDKIWRRHAIAQLADLGSPHVLDAATGTGDMAIAINKRLKCSVVGSDLSAQMLEVAKQKVAAKNLQQHIELVHADTEQLPFADGQFDAATVAFGVRNFENLDKGLAELSRVVRKDGLVVVLEFSKPRSFPFKQLYMLYFKHILPTVGGLVSHNRNAYEYLPKSVMAFPDGADFERHMVGAGLEPIKRRPQTFGIATIYVGRKK